MYAYFPPPDAAVILRARLANLDPLAPDPQLIHSSYRQADVLSGLQHPDASGLLKRLREHLTSFEYPTVPPPGEDEPPNLEDAHTDALRIADQLVAIASSTKSCGKISSTH
jgi:hypothetical protein